MSQENFYLTLVCLCIGWLILLIVDMEFDIFDRIHDRIDDYLFNIEFKKQQKISRENYRKAEKELIERVKKIDQELDSSFNT